MFKKIILLVLKAMAILRELLRNPQKMVRAFSLLLLFGVVFFVFSGKAYAGTPPATTDPFYAAYSLLWGWATGTLAKVLAIVGFLIGLGVAAARQSAMPALMGFVLAIVVAVVPNIIMTVIGAVI